MSSPSRTRARKATQEENDNAEKNEQQVALVSAAAQENAEFQKAQMEFLQNRVVALRAEVNRLTEENAALRVSPPQD